MPPKTANSGVSFWGVVFPGIGDLYDAINAAPNAQQQVKDDAGAVGNYIGKTAGGAIQQFGNDLSGGFAGAVIPTQSFDLQKAIFIGIAILAVWFLLVAMRVF